MTSKYEEAVIRLRAAMIERHEAELIAIDNLYRNLDMPIPERKFDFPPMSEKKWSIAEVEDVLMAGVEWFESVRVNGLGSGRWTIAEHDLYRAIQRMVGPLEKAAVDE